MIAGSWPCTFPINWRGAWGHFVYILLDAQGAVAYVGRTGGLVGRLKDHGRNKAFVRWVAKPTEWPDALAYERQLIERHKPYLFSDGTVRSW